MTAQQPAAGSDPDRSLTLHLGPEELVVRGRYEVLSIVNDLLIGIWFTIGSLLFFFESTQEAGTVLFVLGSVQLLLRPSIRLHRRVKLQRMRPGHPAESARDF